MSAKCDYCGQPGIQLVGETNGVLVCIDHAAKVDTPRYTPDEVEALVQQVAECEWLLRMTMDARDRAERQAERLEARIARAERLIDSWEHDAPDHSNPVFIGRLRECLHRDPAPIRLREEGGGEDA